MTVVAALEREGRVYMAADSEVTAGWQKGNHVAEQGKLFRLDDMIVGVSGSVRAHQIIRYHVSKPVHHAEIGNMEFLVTSVIPAFTEAAFEHGFQAKKNEMISLGMNGQEAMLLIGYRGGIFRISEDYSVLNMSHGYDAIGVGSDVALGVIFAMKKLDPENKMAPKDILFTAVMAAIQHSNGVGGAPVFIREED